MSQYQPPIDQHARERALDTRSSFAVSAPAGSGKTGLLTQRVLALLAQCEEPENVLAITFTRKAAAEMQARILQALQHAQQHTSEPEADYAKTTWRLARAVLQRNHDKQWQLFDCPNRLRITTIDSLCRSLAQQMPFASQLGQTPEILDNANTAYQMAARETLKQLNTPNDLQDDLIQLAKHFDNQLDRIEHLLVQLLAKRDQWLSILFAAKDNRQVLETILNEVIEEKLGHCQNTLQSLSSELAILADHAANNLQGNISAISHCHGLTGLPAKHPAAIPQWLGLAELLLTQKGELRKSATKAIGFLAPSDKSLSKEQQALAKTFKERFSALLTQCQQSPQLQQAIETQLHQVRTLPAEHYQPTQWQLLNSLTRILLHLASKLNLVFQQLGQADYLSITLAALDALGDSHEPTDLALALDYKIQHILVDEFQDTSTTQLTLLKRLSAGWQMDDGRTVFIVGDAMQSCYRFRDANVGIFLNVREQGIGDIALEPLDLQVNFRSQAGIVEWVNNSFQHIFPLSSDSNRGAVSYSPSTSVNPSLDIPAVQTHLLAYPDSPGARTDEAATVVDLVKHHQQQTPNNTIALLVRSKAHAQPIIAALEHAKLDYHATDIDRLDTCMPVLDLLSLTKALLYPNDRMAWLTILRAPWCALDMHDLSTITHSVKGQISTDSYTVLSLLNSEQSTQDISDAGKIRLARFMRVINTALAQRQRLSLRRWLQGIWMSLGGASLLINKSDQSNIDTFFELIEHYEQGGLINRWEEIEQAVMQLYAKPKTTAHTTAQPLQIMSIHKSKGLEFDTVIIPSLDKKPRPYDKGLLLWLERMGYNPTTGQQEPQLLISPVNATGENNDPIYQFIWQQHNEKEQLESDRLLYVGCTRAIQQLHLIAYVGLNSTESSTPTLEHIKAPSGNSLLHRLWPSVQHNSHQHLHITPAANSTAANQPQTQHPNIIMGLHTHWQAPVIQPNDLLKPYRGNNLLAKINKPTPTIEQHDLFNPAEPVAEPATKENLAPRDPLLQREQRYIGNIIHQALEHITQTNYRLWDAQRITQQQEIWKSQLQQQGINPQQLNNALHNVCKAINNTLQDNKGQWLLDHTHQDSATELELWNESGQHIIDRTFIELDKHSQQTTRWIIDYKSSQIEPPQTANAFKQTQKQQHAPQLQRYRNLFKHEKNAIRTALYFPLIPLFLEV